MIQHYLIFYDIKEPRRLIRVSKVVEDFGIRMQKSFFEADMSKETSCRLEARLRGVIDDAEDGVKIFRLCAKCEPLRIAVGTDVDFVPYSEWRICD